VNFGISGLSKPRWRRERSSEVRAGPSGLQKQVVRPSEREQPALDGMLRVFGAWHYRLCEAMA
jgi:hypothetical protein